jgi:hypothetical protein
MMMFRLSDLRCVLCRLTLSLTVCGIVRAAPPASAPTGQPAPAVLQARIHIPESLITEAPLDNDPAKADGKTYRYGGDLRIGDLDDDGTVDFVLAKSLGGQKNCYLAAFTWDGRILWQWGDKDRRAASADPDNDTSFVQPPARPGPLLVIDIDGDDHMEVVSLVINDGVDRTSQWEMSDTAFVILDGASGRVERRHAPEPLRAANALDDDGKHQPPNYVHQRLLAADLRGTGAPRDFVIKIGNTVLACDEKLEPLWTYHNRFAVYGRHSSYIPCVGNVDVDPADEVFGGNYLIDDDGSVLWERMMASHNDSVAIADWDGISSNGAECIMSGFGQVVDTEGTVLVRLGKEVVPHGQELRVGRFRDDLPGLQMAFRYNGHNPEILYADRAGEVLTRLEIDPTPLNVGMETVRWFGPDAPDLLFSPPALWDGRGRRVVVLPDVPPPSRHARMGWYHCIPADLDGTGTESVVLFDPCTDVIHIYGARPLQRIPPTGYRHTPRQYNVRLMD